jgi:DNA polymerase III epsilon subunit-like protein
MKILVFDTETSGLPEKRASIYHHSKWPYIIQISYILYDLSDNSVIIKDNYVKIDNSIVIPPDSFDKHHLTHEILNEKGINIIQAMKEFNEYLKIADLVVGHNISFDKRMVFVECFRHRINQYFTVFKGKEKINKTEFCTMKNTTKYCKIERLSKTNTLYYKTPSLTELYFKLFPNVNLPKNLHNSLVDVLITLRCYIKYQHNFDILEVNNTLNNLFNSYQ